MKKIKFYDNKNVIFNQLKIARVNSKMSQSQLAAKMQIMNVNIDQQMISKIENNMRFITDYELACFCEILDVDEKFLLKDCYNNFVNEK